eukprot:CAMPEP_0183356352 /NCGR_PEP_ID=MMETSP0164_2-20130417/44097_1 /TAXON_ID=221442 /ORGANISM="Coccolithus pelagicus ssp braarudi, Strain PLY182g" /LENGTH=173 /DNA_ID=CAMNT_0025529741 /DNA_START=157 /DNA_END=674 /DNA_ORIENTATION=-
MPRPDSATLLRKAAEDKKQRRFTFALTPSQPYGSDPQGDSARTPETAEGSRVQKLFKDIGVGTKDHPFPQTAADIERESDEWISGNVGMCLEGIIRSVSEKIAKEKTKEKNKRTRKSRLMEGEVVKKRRSYSSTERSAIVKHFDQKGATLKVQKLKFSRPWILDFLKRNVHGA